MYNRINQLSLQPFNMPGIDNKVYNRILLFVLGIPVFFLLLFAVISVLQLRDINTRIESGQSKLVRELVVQNAALDSISENHRQFLTLALLEEESLGERYRQGHYSLASRSFKQFLGFFTGIIMVIVGCVFVLLKLKEDINATGSRGEQFTFSLVTNSPGVLFGIVGAVLIGITSSTNDKITVRDAGLYLTREYLVAPYFGAKGYSVDLNELMKETVSENEETEKNATDTLILQSPPAQSGSRLIIQHPPKK